MAFSRLKKFEAERAAVHAAEAEDAKRRELRQAVRSVIPRSMRTVPKRGRGRTPAGGVSRREVEAMRERAIRYLDGTEGVRELETEVQRQAIVILLIDGVLGTEPWRASQGPHGGLVAANARIRYLDNAMRILEDMRRRLGQTGEPQKLLEGVIDAVRSDGKTDS